jgi:hypothetical protein
MGPITIITQGVLAHLHLQLLTLVVAPVLSILPQMGVIVVLEVLGVSQVEKPLFVMRLRT